MTEEEESEHLKLEEQALVAVCKAAYASGTDGDLQFETCDIIFDLEDEGGGWWSGKLDSGVRGMFPSTYVRFIPKSMLTEGKTANLCRRPVGTPMVVEQQRLLAKSSEGRGEFYDYNANGGTPETESTPSPVLRPSLDRAGSRSLIFLEADGDEDSDDDEEQNAETDDMAAVRLKAWCFW